MSYMSYMYICMRIPTNRSPQVELDMVVEINGVKIKTFGGTSPQPQMLKKESSLATCSWPSVKDLPRAVAQNM